MRSLLVTYDCEYDKPSTKLVMAAGIFSLADVPADRRGNVRKNKVFSTFYLEENAAWKRTQLLMRHLRTFEMLVFWRRPSLQRGRKHGCSLLVTPHGSRCKNSFHLSSAMGADGSTL